MHRPYNILILLAALMMVLVPSTFAQDQEESNVVDVEGEKTAQTGMKFLSTSMDARATALGGAVTADESFASSAALLYNPATMARMNNTFHVGISNVDFIADIQYSGFTAAFQPAGGNLGVFGLSIVSVDYGDILNTIKDDTEASGYQDVGVFSPTALAVGFGYARSFTEITETVDFRATPPIWRPTVGV